MGSDSAKIKSKKKVSYFFLDIWDEEKEKHRPMLHRSLHINRATDTITTWCYPLAKRVAYSYSQTKKVREPAFSTMQVCEMMNRKRFTIEMAIVRGNVSPPQLSYGLDENRNTWAYFWHEENIMEMHAFLSTVHRGRPRLDGLITPAALPSVRELRAMIRQEEVLYVKNSDGVFTPVWKAQNFD